jgi:hypothetical protein
MEKAEISRIADYLVDLEEGLYEWDYRGITTLRDLGELYQIIEQLLKATFETKDEKVGSFLVFLEYKARKCRECIETGLAVRNYDRQSLKWCGER